MERGSKFPRTGKVDATLGIGKEEKKMNEEVTTSISDQVFGDKTIDIDMDKEEVCRV